MASMDLNHRMRIFHVLSQFTTYRTLKLFEASKLSARSVPTPANMLGTTSPSRLLGVSQGALEMGVIRAYPIPTQPFHCPFPYLGAEMRVL